MALLVDTKAKDVYSLIKGKIIKKTDNSRSATGQLLKEKNEILLGFLNSLSKRYDLKSWRQVDFDIDVDVGRKSNMLEIDFYYRNDIQYGETKILFELDKVLSVKSAIHLRGQDEMFLLPMGYFKL